MSFQTDNQDTLEPECQTNLLVTVNTSTQLDLQELSIQTRLFTQAVLAI